MLTHAWNPGQTAGVTSGLHLVLSPCCSPTILTPCCSAMLFWHVVRACCSFSKSSTHSRRHAARCARCATSCLGNHHNLGLGGRHGGCSVTRRPPRLVCPSHPRHSAVAHRPRSVRSFAPDTTRVSRQSLAAQAPASPQSKRRRSPPPPRRASVSSKGKRRASSAPSKPALMMQCRGLPPTVLITTGTSPQTAASKHWDEAKMHELASTLCKMDETSSVPSVTINASKGSEDQASFQRHRSVCRGRTARR